MAGLAGVMNSPMPSEQTMIRHQRTVHDVTLGSMASGFDADAEEAAAEAEDGDGTSGQRQDRVLRELSSHTTAHSRPSPPTDDGGKLPPPPTSRTAAARDRETARLRQLGRELGADSSVNTESAANRSSQQQQTVPGPRTYIQIGNGSSNELDDSQEQLTKSVVDISGVSPGWGSSKDGGGGYLDARPGSSAGRRRTEGGVVPELQEQTLKKQMEDYEKLRAENFEFRLILDQLRDTMDSLGDANMNEVLRDNATLKANKARLERDLKRHAKLAKQAEGALKDVIAERDAADRRVDQLERSIRERSGGASSADLEAMKRRVGELEGHVADAEDEADRWRQEAEDLRKELEANQGADVERLQDELDEVCRSEQRWKDTAEERMEQLEDLRQQLDAVTDARDRAEDALANAGTAAQEQEDRERELRKLRERVEQHKADNESLRNELEVTRTRLHSRDDERKEYLSKIQLLSDELDLVTQEHAKLKHSGDLASDVDRMQAERDRAEAELEQVTLECNQLRELVDELESRVAGHEDDLARVADEWQAEVTDREQQLEEALERVKAAERELADKDADVVGTNKDLKASADHIWELEQLNEQLKLDKQKLIDELTTADAQLSDAEQIEKRLKQSIAELEADCEHLQALHRQLEDDRDNHRITVDELSQQLADLEARHRRDNEARRQALEERDDLEADLRRARTSKTEYDALRRDLERDAEKWRRTVHEKEEANARLANEVESARKRLGQREKDVQELQSALRSLEDDRRKIGDEHTSDRFGLELEIERVKRDLARSEEEASEASESVRKLEHLLGERESEVASLRIDIHDLEDKLMSERQERLSLSDRLTAAQKAAKRSEADADSLRDRLSDLERRLAHDQRALSTSQRSVDTSKKEALELLSSVYVRVAKMTGSDEVDAPSTPAAMKDKLMPRLRILSQATSDFERKLKTVETALEQKFSGLQRELESKKRLLDNVENSMNKMMNAKLAWKAKLALKEDELADAKARHRDLQSQLSTLRASSTADGSNELRSLTARAMSAEKRVATLSNQLSTLQDQVAEQERKHSEATSKWEARVAEFEKRLKAANERVKAEKQGGKERAAQLEGTVKNLQEQLKQTNARNERLSGFLSAARVTARTDPDAL